MNTHWFSTSRSWGNGWPANRFDELCGQIYWFQKLKEGKVTVNTLRNVVGVTDDLSDFKIHSIVLCIEQIVFPQTDGEGGSRPLE